MKWICYKITGDKVKKGLFRRSICIFYWTVKKGMANIFRFCQWNDPKIMFVFVKITISRSKCNTVGTSDHFGQHRLIIRLKIRKRLKISKFKKMVDKIGKFCIAWQNERVIFGIAKTDILMTGQWMVF